jgi:hypothetical protein
VATQGHPQRELNARTDIVALAQAKADIRALVERDFNRKSTRGRKRHARFLEDHTSTTTPVLMLEAVRDLTWSIPIRIPWTMLPRRIRRAIRTLSGPTFLQMTKRCQSSKQISICLAFQLQRHMPPAYTKNNDGFDGALGTDTRQISTIQGCRLANPSLFR